MADQGVVVGCGSSKGLRFELAWASDAPMGTADEATLASLTASVKGTPVWGVPSAGAVSGFIWPLVEVLEHVAWAWPYLTCEESAPLRLNSYPDRLRAEAQFRWEKMPSETRVAEQRELLAYEDCHDLSRAFHGCWPEPLWVQKLGKDFLVQCKGERYLLPPTEVVEPISHLASQIADRLKGVHDPRAREAVRSWDARDLITLERRLAIAMGVPPERVRGIGGDDPERVFECSVELQCEFVAVTRMSAHALSDKQIKDLLHRLRSVRRKETPKLDRVSLEAKSILQPICHELYFDQGYRLADWFRTDHLGLGEDRRVDPENVLSDLGVALQKVDIDSSLIDAVCVWGPARGPVVLVNPNGEHGTGYPRNATLAHEICHLLVDRDGALPVAEVRGGRVPDMIESRANAFAAELLVPGVVARRFFDEADPETAMNALQGRFKASKQLIALQAINTRAAFDSMTLSFLNSFAKCRSEP
jgi:hypothetical protein